MGSESQKNSRGKRKATSDPAGPGAVRAMLPCCGKIDNASDLKHRVQDLLDAVEQIQQRSDRVPSSALLKLN
ncbi:hypothetical protein AOXY_G30107 [Acipenser oxyrinchus oxyrinchus]|uniref:Uncharacterized protein n=1 Tax=Acipenser oxyrinchus oxyrinchus TaxID=40147 RepID=A0AAD8FRQ5_ACIOX|nr:hypothetical protein AOXY_G30107 [Acipenser oxyrinchus oxyrinchus]